MQANLLYYLVLLQLNLKLLITLLLHLFLNWGWLNTEMPEVFVWLIYLEL